MDSPGDEAKVERASSALSDVDIGSWTQRFDLLVVGYMGHSALYNRIIGSTTDRLVELAACHVLVVK